MFGLPNGRTDWCATDTPSGSEAAMPLMFANFLRRLTIPEPWHSDFDGLHASRSCRNWTASRTASRNWIANRTASRSWIAICLRAVTIGFGWFLISELGLHVLGAIPIWFGRALPPPPVSKAVVGRSPFDPAALPAFVAPTERVGLVCPMCASDSQRPRHLLELSRHRHVMVGAFVAVCNVWMVSILKPFLVVRNPSVDLVPAHLASH